MHRHAYKQYMFWSYSTSTFTAMRFDENPFTSKKKKKKRRKKKKKKKKVSSFAALFTVVFK